MVAILSGVFVGFEKGALREVVRTHEGALIALVAALDAREHQTELHSIRVQAYSLRLGRELGIKPDQMHILEQASLLHDVGKIGTPDQVLLKPGPLTDEQWQVMHRHPEVGRNILRSVPFLKDAAEIVYAHHEKYDGTGYPQGLSGEQIPLAARIFSVVDVFDALTSDRPYYRKKSGDEARRQIEQDKGNHFDPKVVQAFLRIPLTEWKRIATRITSHAP